MYMSICLVWVRVPLNADIISLQMTAFHGRVMYAASQCVSCCVDYSVYTPDTVECQTLSDIDNGRVEMDGRVQGSIATYSCNPGYMLQGDALRICTEDGVWSNSEPMCNISESTMVLTLSILKRLP